MDFFSFSYHAGLTNYWLPALVKKYPDVASSLEVPNLAGSIMLLKVQRKEIGVNKYFFISIFYAPIGFASV